MGLSFRFPNALYRKRMGRAMVVVVSSGAFPAVTEMIRAKKRKTTANPKVSQVTTFSDPRSFVLAKTFNPPPVIAPEAPSDLPPWSKERTMMMRATIRKITSYHFIAFFLLSAKSLYKIHFAHEGFKK